MIKEFIQRGIVWILGLFAIPVAFGATILISPTAHDTFIDGIKLDGTKSFTLQVFCEENSENMKKKNLDKDFVCQKADIKEAMVNIGVKLERHSYLSKINTCWNTHNDITQQTKDCKQIIFEIVR